MEPLVRKRTGLEREENKMDESIRYLYRQRRC